MSFKRPRSPGIGSEIIPSTKKQRTDHGSLRRHLPFESLLADELVLVIFGNLHAVDLCHCESVSRSWRRLATDNELWKALFHHDFKLSRLRGARSTGILSRPMKPLHGHLPIPPLLPVTSHWKELYRIGRNWQTGRSVRILETPLYSDVTNSLASPLVLLIGRDALITSNGVFETSPEVNVSMQNSTMSIVSSKRSNVHATRASSISLNQGAIASDGAFTLAVFYSTAKRFHHLSTFSVNATTKSSMETHIITPVTFRGPIIHSAYHSSLLISLSSTFQVDIYHVSAKDASKPILVQTMSSFTSFPPSSLTVCRPSSLSHKVLLSYAVPIYPAHWSVATTELQVDDGADILSSRTLRALPQGWEAVEENASSSGNDSPPRTGGSKMPGIVSVQSDGRFLVVAPRNENYMELYRLRANALVFVRILFGPIKAICALTVADARCISISLDGALWIHDLDLGWGVEVQDKIDGVDLENTRIYFDDRRIVVTTPTQLRTISFD